MEAARKIESPQVGRPVKREFAPRATATLLQAKLSASGVLELSLSPNLAGWAGIERRLAGVMEALAYPPAAPKTDGKRHPTRGRAFDLKALFNRLNSQYFDSLLAVDICWSRERSASQKRRASIRFGSYCYDDRQIRINPLLDDPQVPLYYVEYVIYHEMCHAFVGIEHDATGRPRYHGRKFKEREERFVEYRRAMAWEEANTQRFFQESPLAGWSSASQDEPADEEE